MQGIPGDAQPSKAQQHDCCTLSLRGRAGGKSLTLEFADRVMFEENRVLAAQWLEVLRYLILVKSS